MLGTGLRTVDRHVVGFADALRQAGLGVSLGCTLDFGRAVAEVGADTAEGVYWAGRATLINRPEDVPLYDEVFGAHWLRRVSAAAEVAEVPPLSLIFDDVLPGDDEALDGPSSDKTFAVRYSRSEVLGAKDFAECTDRELDELHDLMTRLRFECPTRRCRRLRPSAHRGRPDLRRAATRDDPGDPGRGARRG